jgi:hypothetical protein
LLAQAQYEGFFWLDGQMHPIAAFDAATMQQASPDPAVFTAASPTSSPLLSASEEAAAMLPKL